jgi:hypothetical protein
MHWGPNLILKIFKSGKSQGTTRTLQKKLNQRLWKKICLKKNKGDEKKKRQRERRDTKQMREEMRKEEKLEAHGTISDNTFLSSLLSLMTKKNVIFNSLRAAMSQFVNFIQPISFSITVLL